MDELEELRQQRLRQIQAANTQAVQEQAREDSAAQEQLIQLENIARKILDKNAMERYATLKMAHPNKAIQSLVAIARLAQQGYSSISDQQFKELLKQLEPKRKEFTITRK